MKFFRAVMRFLLRVRYDITLNDPQLIKKYKNTLILPNHVALVDPLIVFAMLAKYGDFHPVVVSTYTENWLLKPIFKFLGTISIQDNIDSEDAKKSVESAMKHVKKELSHGKNIVLYPSGGLKTQAEEVIAGKKGAWLAIQDIKSTTGVVAITIDGLRGSSTSKAWMGTTPSLLSVFLRTLRVLVANLIFFIPKRKVMLTCTDITRSAKEKQTLQELNSFLENIYNKNGGELLIYKPYFFYYNDTKKRHLPDILSKKSQSISKDYSDIAEAEEILRNIILRIKAIKSDITKQITYDTHMIFDLYFDSLDTAELKTMIQNDYPGASNPALLDLQHVGDFVRMALGKGSSVAELKPCHWKETSTGSIKQILEDITENETILTLFKKQFSQHRSDSFCFDGSFGVQTKNDYLIKAYLLAAFIKKYEGEYVGIMLPAVTASSLLVVATYLAGKTPVMLNWTFGESAFDYAVTYKSLAVVLTSRAFYTKIEKPAYSKYTFTFLEDILKNIPLSKKITALIKSKIFALPMSVSKNTNQEAVILFTSGSEALPKAVSLTHKNILANLYGALDNLTITYDDVLLGFLPPFHSFGFTVNTILPLITGLRVVYTPDPNDSKTIAQMIAHTGVTAITSTPTFIKKILGVATKEQLKSIKFLVVGAEKCPEAVFHTFHKLVPDGLVLEGYGITECSPVIAVNPMNGKIKHGTVGKPIGGLELLITDLQDNHILPPGQEGMICVCGPSIFGGYDDKNLESPFIEITGKQFYKTGDLGYVDREGYLYITGRLKRFVKVAGEMISLPFLESLVLQEYGRDDEVNLAIEAKERDNGTAHIVLFTVDSIEKDAVNAYLRKKGVNNLMQIDEVRKVDIIPILGTGKTDYKILKNMIE